MGPYPEKCDYTWYDEMYKHTEHMCGLLEGHVIARGSRHRCNKINNNGRFCGAEHE